jgi:hypothetical protein
MREIQEAVEGLPPDFLAHSEGSIGTSSRGAVRSIVRAPGLNERLGFARALTISR